MPEYLSPGVYIEEVDAGPRPIAGVSTSTAGMVGVTRRGPTTGKPKLVTNFLEFQTTFGGFLPEPDPLIRDKWANDPTEGGRWWLFPLAVKGFFDNGGQRLFVKRVASADAEPASGTLRAGLVSQIVVSQAEAQLESTLALLRDTQRARADLEHALAIVCGEPAPSFAQAPNPLLEVIPPSVPPGLPSELLTRRPDVAQAEQNVVAANAQIGVATAEFFPRFTLTATAGLESFDIGTLFTWQSRAASILPSVSIPIFQGGRLKANLEATRAAYRQTVAAYVNQVLIAYGDVENALNDLHATTDEVQHLRAAATSSREYLRLANVQYKQGLVDYLIVIDAERTLLANQVSLAQMMNLQMNASIQLIKALGGGWAQAEAAAVTR
jgi:NodT family efflux transporter outer membrane factor (OMF) lipoprotein